MTTAIVKALGLSRTETAVVAAQLFDRICYQELARIRGVKVKSIRQAKYRARLRAKAHGIEIPKRPKPRGKLPVLK